MVLHVGLTGSIGAGKTTVARRFAAHGATVVDADALVADAYRQPHVLQALEAHFGPAAVVAGEVQRAVLAARVFEDAGERRWLEALVHPVVADLREAATRAAKAAGARVIVHDVPLLFETGLDHQMDLSVLVTAPLEARAARVQARSGMSREAFDARNAAQMSDAEKRKQADVVLANDADLEALQGAADRVWRERIAPRAG
jgi:dephospho-CoA kinase